MTGFGGPPAHVVLLRQLMVERTAWIGAHEFEDANAACSLLPGPASTQLAIFCAYRVAGPAGAVVGGVGFVLPAVCAVLLLSVLFLGSSPPLWVRGAGAGAGAVLAAVAARAARGLIGPSLTRVRTSTAKAVRWAVYLTVGAAAAVLLGSYLAAVLVGCGLLELGLTRLPRGSRTGSAATSLAPLASSVSTGGLGALAWTAFKVGALSFGGGFVIIPLMQSDAVHVYHWMTEQQFLSAVALGQVTPGPVVATVAAVGYAAHGVAGALLASAVAFVPSFTFVLLGGRRFQRLRADHRVRAFLAGAAPAAIGAIAGAAVTLALALQEGWQFALLAVAALVLLVLERNVVATILGAGAAGVVLALAGAPVP